MSAAERSEAEGLGNDSERAQQELAAPAGSSSAAPWGFEAHVQSLQRTAGNRAVTALVQSGRLGNAERRDLARAPTRVSFNISEPRVGGGRYATHAGFDVEIDGIEVTPLRRSG